MEGKKELYDFRKFGKAIKAARMERQWTREEAAAKVNIAPRYLLSIENEGQHPSLQIFYELVTLFDISVDQFFFPSQDLEKSTKRRQLDALLDTIDENDLTIVIETVRGIKKARSGEEQRELQGCF